MTQSPSGRKVTKTKLILRDQFERFPSECHKAQTKIITLANHKQHKDLIANHSKQIVYLLFQAGKTHVIKSELVLVFQLIG